MNARIAAIVNRWSFRVYWDEKSKLKKYGESYSLKLGDPQRSLMSVSS